MSNDSSPKCPQCGTPLPENAPAGLCPNCLMGLNLKTETVFTDDSQAAHPPLPPEQIAPHFPQLEILECLGRGGMGVVYKARQKSLNRLVALKLLAPERVRDARFAERFAREAQALAALNHPNIVTIYDFGQAGGFYFLLMEFVDGLNLRQLLRTRKFTPEEALAIVPPLCDALQFAHDRGIVHRDIKPENLLLGKAGQVKVADFGIAKMLGTVNGTGQKGEVATAENATQNAVGTPSYSAPEQKTDPQRVDSRADIYSLGVVFYEMLTGELPGKKIEAPSRKVQIDVRLDEIVLRALETKPELRYQQVSEVKTMVETIVGTPPNPPGPFGQTSKLGQGLDYRSKATLFGLPWLHVTSGCDPQTRRVRVAKGIIAIGGVAQGVIAFGGVAMGGFAFGGLAMGVFAFGGCAFGLFSFGGLAVALIAALGGGAMAPIALGGGAIGYYAFGGGCLGVHVLNSTTRDPLAQHFFLQWANRLTANLQWLNAALMVFVVGIGVGVPLWLQRRTNAGRPGEDETIPVAATRLWRPIFVALILMVALIVTIGMFQHNHRIKAPVEQLAQETFLQKFAANQIAHSTITAAQSGLPLTEIRGTYFKVGQNGGAEEVPFEVHKAWLTPGMMSNLMQSPRIEIKTSNGTLLNVVWGIAPFVFLGAPILFVLGILYVVWRLVKKTRGSSAPPIIQKPDRFWRWFAVAVLAMIAIPMAISILGLLAAIAIPNFVKARQRALENARHTAQADAQNADSDSGPAFPPWVTTNAQFVARLDQGSVQLVGIRYQALTNTVCWLANGALPDKPFLAGDPLTEYVPAEESNLIGKRAIFWIHSKNTNGPVSSARYYFNKESGVVMEGVTTVSDGPRSRHTVFYLDFLCPTNAKTADMSFGVANGSWKVACILDHKDNFSGSVVSRAPGMVASYNSVYGDHGEVAVNCNYSKSKDWETRLIGVDDEGQTTVVPENSTLVSNDQTGGILLMSSNAFTHIKEFQLQRRPYEWVEFRNVSLEPGYATTVEVKDADAIKGSGSVGGP